MLIIFIILVCYTRRPRRPPGRLVPSCGSGVTSSILPIRRPDLARARIAGCAPGPGVFLKVAPWRSYFNMDSSYPFLFCFVSDS